MRESIQQIHASKRSQPALFKIFGHNTPRPRRTWSRSTGPTDASTKLPAADKEEKRGRETEKERRREAEKGIFRMQLCHSNTPSALSTPISGSMVAVPSVAPAAIIPTHRLIEEAPRIAATNTSAKHHSLNFTELDERAYSVARERSSSLIGTQNRGSTSLKPRDPYLDRNPEPRALVLHIGKTCAPNRGGASHLVSLLRQGGLGRSCPYAPCTRLSSALPTTGRLTARSMRLKVRGPRLPALGFADLPHRHPPLPAPRTAGPSPPPRIPRPPPTTARCPPPSRR